MPELTLAELSLEVANLRRLLLDIYQVLFELDLVPHSIYAFG